MDQLAYEKFRQDLADGKIVHHEGRTAGDMEELNWLASTVYTGIATRGPDMVNSTDELVELRAENETLRARVAELEAAVGPYEETSDEVPVDLEIMMVSGLKQFADERGITLSPNLSKKADIVAAIREAMPE